MKHACRYAIVRFMPYPETGEFANIGIVLMSPTAKFFGYKLIERVTRITAFFEELDANIFRKARRVYTDELMRITQSVERAFMESPGGPNAGFADFVFNELVRPREGLITAQGDRIAMAEETPNDKLQELFDHYVGRAFATKAYQERNVEKRVHGILRDADLTRLYQEHMLGNNDTYKARLPFVRLNNAGQATRAIKPIFLAHDDPSRLYDHGWDWIGKIQKLRRDKTLQGDVLFAAQAPAEDFGPRASAFAEIIEQLKSNDIALAQETERNRILTFAADIPEMETSDSD